jgi:hypothetical protein
MPSIALVSEGEFDIHAYSPLIQRENEVEVDVLKRPCGKSVSGRFVSILTALKYLHAALDKAIVVSDAHGRDPAAWRAELQGQAGHLVLPFPIEYVVIVEELEAILLCDPRAIECVCAERGNAIQLPNLTHSPALLPKPKVELVRQLGLGKVKYTKIIAGEIAGRADLERLCNWSPSYRNFRAAVRL